MIWTYILIESNCIFLPIVFFFNLYLVSEIHPIYICSYNSLILYFYIILIHYVKLQFIHIMNGYMDFFQDFAIIM